MTPLLVTELASIVILSFFLAHLLRRGLRAQPADAAPRRRALLDLALLGCGAWLAEQTCITLYDFYQYDAPWKIFVGDVPLLVVFIWPFVIVSAREVCHALEWRTAAGHAHPLAVALMVLYDAALVEPVAVRAGLWSWNEPGLFGVPWIGLVGWACYAGAASALLDALPGLRRVALVLLAPVATHALLLGFWWGGLRWGWRDALPAAAGTALSVVAGSGLSAIFFQWRRKDRLVDLPVMVPRMLAAALFFALLFWRGADVLPLVFFGLPFAAPYFMATRYRSRPV